MKPSDQVKKIACLPCRGRIRAVVSLRFVRSAAAFACTVGAWIGIVSAAPVWAAPVPHSLSELQHATFTPREGAPTAVQALAQTPDGFLWVGAASGLFRFDGVRFERITRLGGQSIENQNVSGLFTDKERGLWIGFTSDGAGYYKAGHYERYGSDKGLHAMLGGLTDLDGVAWLITDQGLTRVVDGKLSKVGPEMGYPAARTTDLRMAADGTIFVAFGGEENSVLFLRRGARMFERTLPALQASALEIGPDGTLWGGDNDGLRALAVATSGQPQPVVSVFKDMTGCILVDRSGGLWFSGAKGLRHVAAARSLLSPGVGKHMPDEAMGVREGLTGSEIWTTFEDREGNVWVGTSGGLDRFRPTILTPVKLPRRALGFAIAAGEGGSIWAGNWGDGLLNLGSTGLKEFPKVGPGIAALYRDPRGTLWVGADRALWKSEGSHFQRVALPEYLKLSIVSALASDASGALWAGRANVGRLSNGEWSKPPTDKGFPAEVSASIMTTSPTGSVWIGKGPSILVYDGQKVVHLTEASSGLSVGAVSAIFLRGSHGWVGGSKGIAYYDGQRFHSLNISGADNYRQINGIVETADGDLWAHGLDEAWHFRSDALRASLPSLEKTVASTKLDAGDGLYGSSTNNAPWPNIIQATDGRLWFATDAGLAYLDPKAVQQIPSAPDLNLQSFAADGTAVALDREISLPPLSRSLEIKYTATALGRPERIRFRYRLEGLEKDWQEVGDRRTAYYNSLQPGVYRFRVSSSDESGRWTSKELVQLFSIRPAWYQTDWFRTVLAAALVLSIWVAYRLRTTVLTARVRQTMQIRTAERERIARDLHDTLLQGFYGLLIRFQALIERVPAEIPVKSDMEKALEICGQLLRRGRERVSELRSDETDGLSPATRLRELAGQLLPSSGATFELKSLGEERALMQTTGDDLCAIASEALLNAFRHAQAKSVVVELHYDHAEFTVVVRDDGVGIDPAVIENGRSGHWGLGGMRERARQIGGTLEIRSERHAGTTVELRLPGRLAYADQHRD